MIRQDFINRMSLARALARTVAAHLSAAISRRGQATLAVSGGTTPELFFEHLSEAEIYWNKVTITLVDERKVPEDHPRSNARLVKSTLLKRKASAAKFVGLYDNAQAETIADFDVCVLGMGNDGHTASFFPQGDRLAEALNPKSPLSILEMNAPGAGETRLTFTLAKLLRARHMFLHIESQDKAKVLTEAQARTDVMKMPIRAILQHNPKLQVYWCP
jgi:6-phosphogluconolactonase